MRVGLITYQHGHRKTLELTLKLLTKDYLVTLFAFPFKKRSLATSMEDVVNGLDRPYRDRPYQLLDYDVKEFCKRYNIGYKEMPGWGDEHADEFDGCDVYLHCTAKIIPASFLSDRTILNCHPGLLPRNRGVDAFKWAIVQGWPIGVTLHAIDEEIDRGIILYRRIVPILNNDKLSDVCLRAYNFEVDLLSNFDKHLNNLRYDWKVGDSWPVSHSKIPKTLDQDIEEIFEARKGLLSTIHTWKPHIEMYPD